MPTKILRVSLLLGVVLLLAAGCASPSRTTTEANAAIVGADALRSGRHRLVVYRTREHLLYLAREIPLRLDGQRLPSLKRGQAIYCDLAPGRHVLESETFDYPGRFELVFTPKATIVFVEALPRSASAGPGLLAGTSPSVAGQLGMLVLGGMTEARLSGQGGLFALVPRANAEATAQLPQLRITPGCPPAGAPTMPPPSPNPPTKT